MNLTNMQILKLIISGVFLILSFFGMIGHLGEKNGFSQLESYKKNYGPGIGKTLHFLKVCILPLLLSCLLILSALIPFSK